MEHSSDLSSTMKTCERHPDHFKEPLAYLCLKKECVSDRVLCRLCIRSEHNHRHHQIAMIDRMIEPFYRLSMNSFQKNSAAKHDELQSKICMINDKITQMQNALDDCFEKLKEKLIRPLQTIAGTYSDDMINQSIEAFTNKLSIDPNPNEVANKLRFLLKVENIPFEDELKRFSEIEKLASGLVEESFQKIDTILRVLDQKIINQFDVINLNLQKWDKIHLDDQIKREELIKDPSKSSIVNQDEERKIDHFPKKRKPYQKRKDKNFQKDVENVNNSQHSFKNELKQIQKIVINLKLDERQIQRVEKSKESSREWLEFFKVTRDKQTVQFLETVEATNINILQIEEIPDMFIGRLISCLAGMKKLQQIRVYDFSLCNVRNILKLFQSLPKDIERIILNCSNEFNGQCVKLIEERQLSKITYLEYFYETHQKMTKCDESFYFKESSKGIRIEPMRLADTIQLMNYLPNLKTVWLNSKNFMRLKNGLNLRKIQYLTLGELDSKTSSVHDKLIDSLESASSLKSLNLLNIEITNEQLDMLLLNNKELESLYIEDCGLITEEVFTQHASTTRIKNYSIKGCCHVAGNFIQKSTQIEVLIMDCPDLAKQSPLIKPFQTMAHLNNLVYLNLYGQRFLDDDLLKTIITIPIIKSLNIGCTNVTDACATTLDKMICLETLGIDDNKISEVTLVFLAISLKKLKKLSICAYYGQNGRGTLDDQTLTSMGKSLSQLEILSIKFCKKIKEYDLTMFKSLKYLEVDLNITEKVRDKLLEISKSMKFKVFLEE